MSRHSGRSASAKAVRPTSFGSPSVWGTCSARPGGGPRPSPTARRCGRRPTRAATAMAHGLSALGVALDRLDRTEEAVGHIERSVAVAREHGLLNVACRSYANLGVLYAQLDPRQGIEACQTGLDTAKKIGDF